MTTSTGIWMRKEKKSYTEKLSYVDCHLKIPSLACERFMFTEDTTLGSW